MRFRDIQSKVKKALRRLYEEDNDLLERGLDEQAISHQLAVKLIDYFPELNIDCEYNGNATAINHRKYIKIENIKLKTISKKQYKPELPDSEMISIPVTPDIIAHQRLINQKNSLILELKKSNNKRKIAFELDKKKLIAYTKPRNLISNDEFCYNFGLLLIVCCGSKCSCDELIWFKKGAIYKEETFVVNKS